MKQQVAVRRQMRHEAREAASGRRAVRRPAGRRLVLLAVLACTAAVTLGAGAAQSLAAGLPDGRAYELVSPANKAAQVEGLTIIVGDQAAADGNALAYLGISPIGSNSPGINDVATRGAAGWTTKDALPPQASSGALALPGYTLFSDDLSKGVVTTGGSMFGTPWGQDFPFLDPGTCTTPLFPNVPTLPPPAATPCSGEPTGHPNAFVVNQSNGSAQLVDSFEDAPTGVTPQGDTGAATVGATPDLSTVVFTDDAALTADASPTSGENLYAWNSATPNDVTLLGVNAALGGGGRVFNAVDGSGSTANIFVTDADGNLDLFHPGSSTPATIAPFVTNSSGSFEASFMDAATDGSTVFYTDDANAALTSDTVANSDANLYESTISSSGAVSNPIDLTGSASLAHVDGVLGASSDGSYVYYVAEGALKAGATSGDENLYVAHIVGQTVTTTFITTLTGDDSADWSGAYTARVTPDGTHLAFDSDSTTLAASQDNGFNNVDANTGNPDTEIYLFDATKPVTTGQANRVDNNPQCASCNETGKQPIGPSSLDEIEQQLNTNGSMYLQRNLSADGSRVFFDSSDAVVPSDNNDQQDVYEYENGQDSLLTSGTSDSASFFLDASTNGNDAFFITRDQLVSQDGDDEYDVYDARVDGGFPAPSPLPPCVGDGCKPAASAPLTAPNVATVNFVGPSGPPASKKKTKKKKAKIAVLSRAVVKGFRFSIKVRVPASGRLAVTGSGLKTMDEQVRGGHSYKLTLALTARERRTMTKKRKGRAKIMVHLLYKPTAGTSSSATVPVTVKA